MGGNTSEKVVDKGYSKNVKLKLNLKKTMKPAMTSW